MKNFRFLAVIVPAALFVLLGAGCSDTINEAVEEAVEETVESSDSSLGSSSGSTKEIIASSGTAKDIYSEAESFAQESNPDATLVFVNNHTLSTSISDYTMPVEARRATDGTSSYWVYVFAKTSDAFTDGEVEADESVAIEFNDGKLRMKNTNDIVSLTFENASLSDSDWNVDSDDAVDAFLSSIEGEDGDPSEVQHVLIEMGPEFFDAETWEYDLTAFTSETLGWEAGVNGSDTTAIADDTAEVEFTPY